MEAEVRDLRLRTGITVPCLVQGDAGAKPVLLLHAWGESRRSFDRLIPLLAGCRIYAPDLRGQGEADTPEDGYSLAEQAKDAAAILDALHVPRASVVGSSSSGYVAQQLDNLLPRSDQETMAARIPGAVLKVYSDVGHMVLWECPERIGEDATAFFRSLAPPPRAVGRTAAGR
jgi:pimeloyl-ACP methyl ester carboxylesterase